MKSLENNWLITLILFFVFVALFGLFIFDLREMLTPILLVAAMLFILWPLRESIIVRRVILLLVFISLFFLYQQAEMIMVPIVLSLVLAYLFDPLIDFFEARKIKRERSILWLILFMIFLMGLGSVFLVPILIEEIQKFIALIPKIKTTVLGWIDIAQVKLTEYGIIEEEKFLDEKIVSGAQDLLEALLGGALKFTKAASGTITQLLNIILIPFLTYYFLVDFDNIRRGALKLVPQEQQKRIAEIARSADRIIGLYIRGQLLVCAIIGVLTSFGLWILGVDYAILLGTMAGISNLIPYVGLTVTLIIAAIVSLFGPTPLLSLVKVGGVFWLVQFLEGSFISPRVVGKVTGLHPAAVMIALLLFANFFGFVGLLIAVPITAVGKVLALEWFERYQRSDFYTGEYEKIVRK